MNKKVIAILTAITAILIMAVPAYADVTPNVPTSTPTPTTYPTGLTLSESEKVYNCLVAQWYLTTLNNNYRRPPLMAVYQIQVTGGYQYHAIILQSNRAGNANYTISYTIMPGDNFNKLILQGAASWMHYVWVDDNTTGWAYAGASEATVQTSGVYYYKTDSTTNGTEFEPKTHHKGNDTLSGNVANRYLAALAAFDTMSTGGSGGTGGTYTEAQYQAYGQEKYADGLRDGHTDVVLTPSDYGLIELAAYNSYVNSHSYTNTQYQNYVNTHSYTNAQYEAYGQQKYAEGQRDAGGGTNVTLPVDDIITAVVEVPNTFLDIVNFDLFGINVAALLVTIVVVVVMIVLLKKVL